MSALDPAATDRLAKLLGMLGSAHDGEIAAAGRAADRFVRDRGMTWSQVLAPKAVAVPVLADDCSRCRATAWFGWRRLADELLDLGDERNLLSDWERQFLVDLQQRLHEPTQKPVLVLRRIAQALGVRT